MPQGMMKMIPSTIQNGPHREASIVDLVVGDSECKADHHDHEKPPLMRDICQKQTEHLECS